MAAIDDNKVAARQRVQREEACNNQIEVMPLAADGSGRGNVRWCLTLVVMDGGKSRVARTTGEIEWTTTMGRCRWQWQRWQQQWWLAVVVGDGGGSSGGGGGGKGVADLVQRLAKKIRRMAWWQVRNGKNLMKGDRGVLPPQNCSVNNGI